MTLAEKLNTLKSFQNMSDSDEVLTAYLNRAGDVIIRRAYPYRDDVTEVPPKYDMLQVEIAQYLLNKRGAEGQTIHNENGVYRMYESGSVPESMLEAVTPFVEVL